MLIDELKEEIQEAYRRLLSEKGFNGRGCQRLMIAEMARSIGNVETNEEGSGSDGPNICVVEAGTGTGKTIAYTIAALPIAKAQGKRLIISTATIALQEQLVNLDLPDIRRHAGLDFSFILAKGRRRYLCLSRLDLALQEMGSLNQTLALYDDERFDPDESHRVLYQDMMESLGRGQWDGDRDSWRAEIDNSAWFRVSTDHVQCTGRRCSHYDNCFFYRARERIHKVDCVVTNHDLVLSDIMMGGGVVLPEPEEAIYIFDEGHHLPEKAGNHFSNFIALKSTQGWLSTIPATLLQMTGELQEIGILPGGLGQFEEAVNDAVAGIEQMSALLDPVQEDAKHSDSGWEFRFPMGVVTDEIAHLSGDLLRQLTRLTNLTDGLVSALEDGVGGADEFDDERYEYWLPIISAMAARHESAMALWNNYMHRDPAGDAPFARWITFRGASGESGVEILLSACPISVSESLNELLWSRVFAAVVTSATLSMAGDFSMFRDKAGIAAENQFSTLPSPFRFHEQAVLNVPAMPVDPREADQHTELVCKLLPDILKDDMGSLVLFTSWRQMLAVIDDIDPAFAEFVLSQGTLSKSEIVSQHKKRIDKGEVSCIFGLTSFSEGIDLPGKYCAHVVLAKIPFAVPDDPVGATLSEWIESKGGNSFQEIMIPDAALKMAQACGRLLRTETDVGQITILDKRLITQRYGTRLLDALPPFRRELGNG
ncbi:MAG: ATP-dependent DNA helicase DinG [Gammaproteobacteria bacterium]|nr:ATP-dependent DNA helicase DinG [Gammaproteobacteria bacterium]